MSSQHPRLHQSSAAAAPVSNAAQEKDSDMPATEKDLAEDAPWKKIQQNTFTRWCNEHLKCVNKRIANLQTDLSDGLRLIGLLEVLSQKKMFRKYNQRPTFRQMQLENVSVALEFLDRENIKLVSIGECPPDFSVDFLSCKSQVTRAHLCATCYIQSFIFYSELLSLGSR